MDSVAKETQTLTQAQEGSTSIPAQFIEGARNLRALYGESISEEGLEHWLTTFMQFDNQIKAYTSEAAEDYETLSEEEKRLRRQMSVDTGDARHDALFIIDGMRSALMDFEEDKHYLVPIVVDHPRKVVERLVRNFEGKKVIEDIQPVETVEEVYNLFHTVLTGNPSARISFDKINSENGLPTMIKGDKIDFYSALYNIVRNSHKRITGKNATGNNIRIQLIKSDDGGTQIEISDDAGGFSDEMRARVKATNNKGEEIETYQAFIRGTTEGTNGNLKNEGAGFGLDITRRVVEDQLGGTIEIGNRKFIGLDGKEGNLGAVTIIKFPC